MIKELIVTPEYLTSQGLNFNLPDRFWSKLDKTSSPHGCWLWTGRLKTGNFGQSGGYGQIWKGAGSTGAHMIYAHRAAWILCRGPIPEEVEVCHDCPGGDNRRCCNPTHLFLGTAADNSFDMFTKGKSTYGENHRRHKLTWEEICAIRASTAEGVEIARIFNTSEGNVSMIRRFKSWNHPLLFHAGTSSKSDRH